MKILFLTNNENTTKLISQIKKFGDEVIRYTEKLDAQFLFSIEVDIIISYNYKYIITEEIINLMQGNIFNLHISMLPWNKGSYPNIWSIIDDTPKGVTIHYINKELDEGDIIFQKEVFIDDNETLASSYNKLHETIQLLVIEHWEELKYHRVCSQKQFERGSKNTIKKTKPYLDIINGNWDMSVKEFKKKINSMDVKV